jgi:hypothetical protein
MTNNPPAVRIFDFSHNYLQKYLFFASKIKFQMVEFGFNFSVLPTYKTGIFIVS